MVKHNVEQRRRDMVSVVRRGASIRQVARAFNVAPPTVLFWVRRAGAQSLDRVDWADRTSGPPIPANKSAREVEDLVLDLRAHLKTQSDLGEFGAGAIRRELHALGIAPLPSVRTIGRILDRRGALDDRRRTRRPAPPRGWYLPDLAAGRAELDSFDVIEGLVIKSGPEVEVLTGISVHGGLAASWPEPAITAPIAVGAMTGHWREVGLPTYAQFDNDSRFYGTHRYPDLVGRVPRLCLHLGVVPVFVPPNETGFQALIESFNGRWQAKVWARFQHASLGALQAQSARFIAASRGKTAVRAESAPARRPIPHGWALDPDAQLHGRIVFLRRTNERGAAALLGHVFPVDARWSHRLVRAEVDLDKHILCFYALRRRQPTWQPLLREVSYALPQHH